MKKYLITILLLNLLFACSKRPMKYDLSKVQSPKDVTLLIDKMKQDKVKIDTSYMTEVLNGQGMHYNGIAVESLITSDNNMTITTDSINFSAKKILEDLETANGFGKYDESWSNAKFKWESEFKNSELELFIKGENLAKTDATDYATLKIDFPKLYDIPIANIHHKVKRFDVEPIYILEIEKSNCNFRIILDDVIIQNFNSNQKDTDYNLNYYILQKGKSKLEFEVRLTEKTYRNTYFTAIISKTINNKKVIVAKKSTREELPKLNKNINFEMTFDAEVPYNIKGWKNGNDLRKEPKLKEKVIALYQKLAQAILKKDKQTINDIFYNYRLETNQVFYDNEYKESSKYWENWLISLDKTYKYNIAQDFKIEFNDKGRLIYTLPNNKSNMLATTGKKFSESFGFFLYQPKDSNELKIIR